MATKRSTLKGGIGSIRGSSGAGHAKKFGNKSAPGDGALPHQLRRAVQTENLAGSPKGPRTGPLPATSPKPPVSRAKAGRRGTPVNS